MFGAESLSHMKANCPDMYREAISQQLRNTIGTSVLTEAEASKRSYMNLERKRVWRERGWLV